MGDISSCRKDKNKINTFDDVTVGLAIINEILESSRYKLEIFVVNKNIGRKIWKRW